MSTLEFINDVLFEAKGKLNFFFNKVEVEKEKARWCPNCGIVEKERDHHVYKLMNLGCILQWHQLNYLPNRKFT